MKRYFVLLAAALLLAACQVPVGSGGTLKVVLPGSGAKATLANSTAVRLQLVRNNVIVPISGGAFLEHSLNGGTVAIDGLAPGQGYVLLVSTGHRNLGETFYTTDLFEQSTPFEITAGADTSVSVTLDTSVVLPVESANSSAHSATVLTGTLYYLNGADLYQASNLTGGNGSSLASGYAGTVGQSNVTGLSNDGGNLWLNTSQGIYTQSSSTSAFTNQVLTGLSSIPAVIDSGTATVGSDSLKYYYGSGLNAGVMVGSDTTWKTVADDLLNLSSDLKDKLQGQIIRGLAVSQGNVGVLSTSLGAYCIVPGMLTDSTELGNDLSNGTDTNGNSIILQPSDTSLLFGPVSVYSNGDGTYYFGGTPKGLYGGQATGTGLPTGGVLNLIAGTAGLNITKLATYESTFNNLVYTAAYSATSREVLVVSNLGLTKRIPVFAGLPSGDLRLTFYKDGSNNLYLVVTGADATVKILIASLS
jgi:hypothetical protein